MNWSNVKLILAREVRDQLRDRRTMFMIVVLPILLYPLLGMTFFQFAQFVEERPTRVLIVGAKGLPADPKLVEDGHFVARFFHPPDKARLLEVDFATDAPSDNAGDASPLQQAQRAVQDGSYEAALYFPPDFGDRLGAFQKAARKGATRLEVPRPVFIRSTANEKSILTFARLSDVWQRWNDEFRRMNLAAANVPETLVTPIEPETVDVAETTGHSGAATWSKVLPVMLLIWALTGAFYPAVDLCAGEKERGTLETLLSSPAERTEIVLGKLATIMLFSGITAVLNVLSIGLMGLLVMTRLAGFGPPPLTGALWLLVALVPVAALFSALCLAVAAFARSTKEGQYYLMPLLLVTMPLAVLPAASGMELTLGNSLIPVTGIVLLLRAALEGNYWQALQFLPPVLGVTLLGCVWAIRWAVDQFNSESVLFRESERMELGLWVHHLLHDRQPTPTVAGALFGGIMVLLIRFFMGFFVPTPHDFRSFAVMAIVTQLAVIATPALLMTLMLTSSPRQTLLLRRPPWLAPMAAALLALAIHPVTRVLQTGVMKLYPLSDEVQKASRAIEGSFAGAALWQVVLVIALAPALCEELAFRGFILSGFRHSGSKWRAIVYSAVFFGLSHSILQQSLVASLVGVVIGYMAVQSGSIVPGMVFHFLHNAMVVISASRPDDPNSCGWGLEPVIEFLRQDTLASWPFLVGGALASILILLWFQRHGTPQHETRADHA